jgi:hypothetical protein
MIEVVASFASGTPPVAPPLNLGLFKAGADFNAGAVVALGADGALTLANQDMTDAFGIALNAGVAADQTSTRVQAIVPGLVLKGPVNAAATVGSTVGLNTTRDGFLTTGSGCIVIRYDADSSVVWCIPTTGALF